jgi:transposase
VLSRIKALYCWLRAVFADSIDDRLPVLLACFLLGPTLIIVRRIAGTGFIVLPRRRVVERTLGWLGRWRRLSTDDEELPEVSEAIVTLAMIRLMLHRLVHPTRKRLPVPRLSKRAVRGGFQKSGRLMPHSFFGLLRIATQHNYCHI